MTDVSSSPGEPDSTAGTAIDTTVPHSARIWNYWLGGKDNYAVDREAGDQYKAIFPGIAVVARTSRAFLTRAVRYLAAEAGMRQFLDVGTGLPTANNTHQVAQQVAPESQDRLRGQRPAGAGARPRPADQQPRGRLRVPGRRHQEPGRDPGGGRGLLDFSQPVALMLMGIMGHFTDDEAYPIVSQLVAGLPSGSYFALYDGANTNEAFNEAQQGYNDSGAVPYYLRSPEQFERLLRGPGAGRAGRGAAGAVAARPGHRAGPRSTPTAGSAGSCSRSRDLLAADMRDITARAPRAGP